MKVLVMGAGGVGGYYGAMLHKDGHDVTLVARGEHLDAIRRRGLRVESVASGDFTVHPAVTQTPDATHEADLVLFCVKGYDNPEAIGLIGPAVGPHTSILTLQNGIGGGDELAADFGRKKVLLGVTYIDGVKKVPGVVAETGEACDIVFGEDDGRTTGRAVAIRDAMAGAGIDVELSSDVLKELWHKLVFICAFSGMICITRATFPEILGTPESEDMTRSALREAVAVGAARGVALDGDIVERTMDRFRAIKGPVVSSMYTDLQRGSRLEIGVLNGAVSRMGKDLGVATPANDFITASLLVSHNRAVAQRSSSSP
jgi:2-dehydropantoate 2-reductase